MSVLRVQRACLFCEQAPAVTTYGLCSACNQIKTIRRVYRVGRGRTPEWEAHLLHLTERAKRRLPLFAAGFVSPHRPHRGWRSPRPRRRIPKLFHVSLPPRELEE